MKSLLNIKNALIVISLLALIGCEESILNSQYVCSAGEQGVYTFDFKEGGVVSMEARRGTKEMSANVAYLISGDRVTIEGAGDAAGFVFKDGELLPESFFSECKRI